MKSKLIQKTWTNEINQVIKPGDPVVFVGSSRGSTSVRTGVFQGVRLGTVVKTSYLYDENGLPIKETITNPRTGNQHTRFKRRTEKTIEVVSVSVADSFSGFISTLPLQRVYKIDTGCIQ